MAYILRRRILVSASPLRLILSRLCHKYDSSSSIIAGRQISKFSSSGSTKDKKEDPKQDNQQSADTDRDRKRKWKRRAIILGGGLCFTAAVPITVCALGFGSGGIVAGTAAVAMQKAAAGTVLAGGVSTLQSIGAAGLTLSQGALTTIVGSAGMRRFIDKTSARRKKNKKDVDNTKEKSKDDDK